MRTGARADVMGGPVSCAVHKHGESSLSLFNFRFNFLVEYPISKIIYFVMMDAGVPFPPFEFQT
jgi:hypothetical protein